MDVISKKDLIENYEFACNQIARYFVKRYYGNPITADYKWVADTVGEVLIINDEFYSVEDMLHYLKNSASREHVFKHYWYSVEERMVGRSPMNFKHFKMNLKNK